jgi:serine/threonine protein kinase
MGDATPNPEPPSNGRESTRPESSPKETISYVSPTEGGPTPTAPQASPASPGLNIEARAIVEVLAPPCEAGEIGRLGPYRIIDVLGVGGMGVVFRAEDPLLRRQVALKTMRPELAARTENRERFLREAQAAAAIEHDHIVPIYQVGEDRGIPFLAMPLLRGETLDERLHREGRPGLPEALRIVRETAEGIAAAHERGLVHRDIKPSNIWLEAPRGRVRILDFGLARFADESPGLTRVGAIVGTPAYMSPEQAGGRPLDPRSDLFSLGCVLYRLATGEPPFRGPDPIATLVAVATARPRPPSAINADLPQAFSDLILSLLEKDPSRRPPSSRAVAESLAAIERCTAAVTSGRSAARPGGQIAPRPPGPTLEPRPIDPPPPAVTIRPKSRKVTWSPLLQVLLGCGAASAVMFLTLGLGLYFVATWAIPELKMDVDRAAESGREWGEIARFWRPPPPKSGPDVLFPGKVEGFVRTGCDRRAGVPDLRIDSEGHHATYRQGDLTIEMYVYRASRLEKEALFKRAIEAIEPPRRSLDQYHDTATKRDRPFGFMMNGRADGPRLVYRTQSPDRRGVFWWDRDWLFLARTDSQADPEAFLKRYLEVLNSR